MEASSDEAASPEEELGDVARVLATEPFALLLLAGCRRPNNTDAADTGELSNGIDCLVDCNGWAATGLVENIAIVGTEGVVLTWTVSDGS